jgi:hypothetical protein
LKDEHLVEPDDINRIRAIFLYPEPRVTVAEAANMLGWSSGRMNEAMEALMAGYIPTKDELVRLQEAFREAKAENDPLLLEDHAFVQTKTYKRALDGYRSLVVGRKGAGKSALLLGFRREREEYYFAHGAIAIRADDFPLEALFSFFYSDSRRAMQKVLKQLSAISDLDGFLQPVRISAYAWSQTLRCAAVYIASRRLLLRGTLAPAQTKKLERARKAIAYYIGQPASHKDSGPEVVFALLVYFFQTVQQVIDNTLGVHTHEISVALAAITHAIALKLSGGLDRRIEDAGPNYRYRAGARTQALPLDAGSI